MVSAWAMPTKNGEGIRGVGHSPNHGAVVVTNDSTGPGVRGERESGIGISAKGGQLAGLFEGSVEITKGLSVQGLDILEQLAAFQAALDQLRLPVVSLKPPVGVPTTGSSLLPVVSADVQDSDGETMLVIGGSGFTPGGSVTFMVTYGLGDAPGAPEAHPINADALGRISYSYGVLCSSSSDPSEKGTWTAQATDNTTHKESEPCPTSCP